jgi:hypothetical protein
MKTVTGVFASTHDATHAAQMLRSIGLPSESITLLIPGKTGEEEQPVPVSAAEQAGVGKALGGVAGAAAGLAGGFELGTLGSSAIIPGIGPVVAIGMAGAALLGLLGAGLGAIAGGALEDATTEGLPEDELFVYEDALRRGRSVVMAFPNDEETASAAKDIFRENGAETVDAAREQWWIGLRSAEKEHYSGSGRNFDQDEKFYRLGFEAAVRSNSRHKEYDQVLSEMTSDLEELQRRYPDFNVEEPFRRGYDRGRHYCEGRSNTAQHDKAA